MKESFELKAEGHEFEIGELVRLRSDLPGEIAAAIPKEIEPGRHYRIYSKREGERKGIVYVGPMNVDPKALSGYDPDSAEDMRRFPQVVPVAAGFFERIPNVLHFPRKK